jgi:cysteinyl-tRNA synthetase
MEYSEEALEAARNGLSHLRNQVRTLMAETQGAADRIDTPLQRKFQQENNDDLNMPRALAVVQKILKADIPPQDKLATVLDCERILGLDLDQVRTEDHLPPEVQAKVEARQQARADKNWDLSDQLRDELIALGYSVQDSKEGMKVFKS